MNIWVNGEKNLVKSQPGEMLSDVLRYQLGLTGTKIGCDEAECGTCTVLLDGNPVLSCTLPAEKAFGKRVKTIEGVALDGELHQVQDAFIKYGAVQCGFCIPGQIMSAVSLLEKNPSPSEDEIRSALKDTLCRCAGYPTIIRAVKAAADPQFEAQLFPGLSEAEDTDFVGHIHQGSNWKAKVTGEAMFTDDLTFPGMLHGRTYRAGVPHAVVKKLDVSQARALAGVRAVLTAEDIPGDRNHGLIIPDWPVLIGVGEKARYVGDALVILAAETREIARQALDLIEVEFEPLPVVADPVKARVPGSQSVHEGGNLLKHIEVEKGDIEHGFREAEIIVEDVFYTAFTEHAYLEPECSIARVTDDGRIEVYVGSQIPYADRDQIARCLTLKPDDVRVIGTLIGGGFGGKEDIAGQIHAALLAQATQQPVKVLYDRVESMMVHPKRHATKISIRIGAKVDGTLVAAKTELYGDTGAYASLGEKVMTRATTHSTGPYVIPHVRADCYAMYTNNPPAGAFRGFGVTQSCFAVESLLDALAFELGMDPVEIRLKNALKVGEVTNTGQHLRESVGLTDCLESVYKAVLEYTDQENPFRSQVVEGNPHLRRAWGIAAAYKNTGLGGGSPDKAEAEVELYTDGTAEVRTSSADMGQGLTTVVQLIAAEELSLTPDKVRVLLSDTDLTPDGGPTTASRQTYVSGNAVRGAAEVVLQAVSTALAEKYDVPPNQIRFIEGLAQVNGTHVPLGQAVEFMKSEGREPKARYTYWAPETQPLGTGGDMHFAYSFAAQAAEVEVDIETGEVRTLRVVAANDVGRAIHPLGLLGQVEGGVMMGLGNALTENFIVEDGQIVTDRLARYRMPSIIQAPEIDSIVVEHPTSDGPYGAKGVGEICSIPTTPAITNAVFNACGVRVRQLPIDQDWLALHLATRREIDG